jgi:hypothetical protein
VLSSNGTLVGAFSFLMRQAQYSSCSLCKAFHASHNNLLDRGELSRHSNQTRTVDFDFTKKGLRNRV